MANPPIQAIAIKNTAPPVFLIRTAANEQIKAAIIWMPKSFPKIVCVMKDRKIFPLTTSDIWVFKINETSETRKKTLPISQISEIGGSNFSNRGECKFPLLSGAKNARPSKIPIRVMNEESVINLATRCKTRFISSVFTSCVSFSLAFAKT